MAGAGRDVRSKKCVFVKVREVVERVRDIFADE